INFMKETIAILIVALMALSMVFAQGQTAAPTAPAAKDYSGYTIRIYSDSNSTERTTWLKEEAKKAGFTISIDDNTVISGDTAAVQAANENKDGDVIFGLNETRWAQLINGDYSNLKIAEYKPSWAAEVGDFKYDGKAYGLVIQNILMLYRTDKVAEELKFEHWSDIAKAGYVWYRQGKVGGTTNANINNSMLYPYTDPSSPAGGISVEGWKALWNYCANGVYTGDSYGFDPLNRGDVQISTFYSSSLYGKIDAAAEGSKDPITADNWKLVDIADGTYYIAEYIGVVDKAGRTAEQTEAVQAFVDWFGSAETQAAWSEEFDSYPCNTGASKKVYGDNIPVIYTIKNFALNTVPGTNMNYASYVGAHSAEWTNIMTNLGFYWADASKAVAEPDWANLDWATLTQKK
ncbi:MAG: ABC transporter substrate-binding protein, partial [Spirochaetales bacterium]|nr:ABC transporter substrate-binding protein [Candidatus Physcosoma equi]